MGKRIGIGLVAVTLVAVMAACGGSDSASKTRNAALPGKQQCLSDDKSSIDDTGVATLSFCSTAKYYSIVAADGTEGDAASVGSDGTATYTAASNLDVIRVKSFDAGKVLVGEDQVTLTKPSCASGAECKVGDTGPGGGIVVYDAGSNQEWGRYIEMARKGWFDNTINSETPSDDPPGNFGCEGTYTGTSTEIGTAKSNFDKWISKCDTKPSYYVRAYRLVDEFNKSGLSRASDWVIPSALDLWAIHGAGEDVLGSLDFPDQALSSSSEQPISLNNGMLVYRFYQYGTRNLAVRNSLDMATWYMPATSKSVWNSFPVRPVHYFSATGPATATIEIVGQMDIPVPPTVPETSIPTPEPGVLPAPIGLFITNGTDDLTVSWQADEEGDKLGTVEVRYSRDGVTLGVPATTATSAVISKTNFELDVEYTFVAVRTSSSDGSTATSDPITLVPRTKAVPPAPSSDSTVAGPDTTMPMSPDSTTVSSGGSDTTMPVSPDSTMVSSGGSDTTSPATEDSVTTEPDERDCNMAPWVGVSPKGDLTSDDVVTLTIKHPCMGDLRPRQYQFVSITTMRETADGPVPAVSRTSSVDADVTSTSYTRHLAAGTHHYLVQYFLDGPGDTYVRSERTLVTIEVGDGGTRVVEPCDFSGVLVKGTTVSFKCSDLEYAGLTEDDGEYKFAEGKISEDRDLATFDISDFGSGWRKVDLVADSGPDTYWLNLFLCASKCDVPKSFDKFALTVNDPEVTVDVPVDCADSRSNAYQLHSLSPNLFAVIQQDWFDGNGAVNLTKATDALALRTSDLGPTCADGVSLDELSMIARTVPVTDTPVEPAPPVVIDVADTTGGGKELPSGGEVKAAPLSVAPEATTAYVTPQAVEALLETKVDGVDVTTVEYSFDGGISWISVGSNGGSLPLPTSAKSVQFRLTTASGKSAVITHDVERGTPTYVKAEDVPEPASKSSGVPVILWVILALIVVAGGAIAVRRRPTQA